MREELGACLDAERSVPLLGRAGCSPTSSARLEHWATGRYSANLPPRDEPEDMGRRGSLELMQLYDGIRPVARRRRRRALLAQKKHEGGQDRAFHRRRVRRSPWRVACPTPFEVFDFRPAAIASREFRKEPRQMFQAAVEAARKAFGGWSGLSPAMPGRAASTRSPGIFRSASASFRRLGDDRQRQADPRDPRYRHPARRAPFLPPRRLGLPDRQRISRGETGRRLRSDHSLEFSAADARLEDRPGARLRQYGRPEACRIHAADGAGFRRNLRRSRPAAGRRQHRDRRRFDR